MTAEIIEFQPYVPRDGYLCTVDPRELAIESTVSGITRELGGLPLHQQIFLQRALELLAEELEQAQRTQSRFEC